MPVPLHRRGYVLMMLELDLGCLGTVLREMAQLSLALMPQRVMVDVRT